MKTIRVRTAFICAKNNFIKCVFSPRMITLMALAVFIYVCAAQPLEKNSALMGKPLNILEPYIAALNSGLLMLIIPLGFLAIFSDFPKIDRGAMFVIIRTGRSNWFCGQIITLLMMSASYLFFIFAASVIPVAFCGFWGTEWSEVALDFGREFPEYSQNFGALLLPKNLFNHLSLLGAAAQSTLFVFAYLILLGMIMMCFTIFGKKAMGVIICGALIAVGSALCSIKADLMWAFPMANSVAWLHYTEFRREPFYPIRCSVLYFAIIIISLIVFSAIMLSRFDCSANSPEEE